MLRTALFSIFLLLRNNTGQTTAFIATGRRRQTSTTSLVAHQTTQNTLQHAGLPPILHNIKCGDSIIGFRKTVHGLHNVTVERVAVSPPIFLLRNFLTHDECDSILSTVETMEPAQTASGIQEDTARRKSFVAWLGNDQADEVVGRLADCARRLMLMPTPSLGVEDMQVLRYDPGGEYIFHHDGNERILTLLYYLNGKGETWFPLAQTADDSDVGLPQTREQAIDLAKKMKPGTDGVLVTASASIQTKSCVKINRGDAVAFYSYIENGALDWKALHAGLPTEHVKHVANHFFRDVAMSRG